MVHYTLYSTLYIIHYTLYIIHYTLYIYINIYTYLYVYIYRYIHIHIHTYTYTYTHIHTYIYIYIYIYIYVNYICVIYLICIYIYIRIHTYIHILCYIYMLLYAHSQSLVQEIRPCLSCSLRKKLLTPSKAGPAASSTWRAQCSQARRNAMSSLKTSSRNLGMPPTIPMPYCVTQARSSSHRPSAWSIPSSSVYLSSNFCCFSFSLEAHCELQKPKPNTPEIVLSWRRLQALRRQVTAPCSKASFKDIFSWLRNASNACSRRFDKSLRSTNSFIGLDLLRALACCNKCSMSSKALPTSCASWLSKFAKPGAVDWRMKTT